MGLGGVEMLGVYVALPAAVAASKFSTHPKRNTANRTEHDLLQDLAAWLHFLLAVQLTDAGGSVCA